MRSTAEHGFTLVETLIALTLLAFGILAVAPMFIYASRANEVGSDLGTLGALAVDQMERLRELDFRDPRLAEGGSLEQNVSTDVAYFSDSDPNGIVRWEIERGTHHRRDIPAGDARLYREYLTLAPWIESIHLARLKAEAGL